MKKDARKLAIQRGLEFIYETARDSQNFRDYGFDYLGCFHCIASTSQDKTLRQTARNMGQERARQWRRKNSRVPANANAEDVVNLVFGSYAANSLGVRDPELTTQLRYTSRKFSANDYLGFDPASEAPPADVPCECECGALNMRGRKTCRDCRKRLMMMTRYAVWQDALIRSYMGERLGVKLGATYPDALKWLPLMRPYPDFVAADEEEFYDAVYAVTHVVYTLNSYSCYRLSPAWLRPEYSFLKQNLERTIEMNDPESMGEFLDALKSFGLKDEHPLIRKGVEYLLAVQNSDGSWGETEADDIYQRYHPTWTAIDGLRQYAWRGKRLSFPRLAPFLKQAAVSKPN